jgi:hypothetical protein
MIGGFLRRLAVVVAERCGWLTWVRADIVERYLDPSSAAIRALEKLFRNYRGFYSASPTPITCVEVAFREGFVAVRNSTDSSRVTVYFSFAEWEAFIAGVKRGRFEVPNRVDADISASAHQTSGSGARSDAPSSFSASLSTTQAARECCGGTARFDGESP